MDGQIATIEGSLEKGGREEVLRKEGDQLHPCNRREAREGERSRRADEISAGQMENFYVMASHFSMKHKTGPPARIGV